MVQRKEMSQDVRDLLDAIQSLPCSYSRRAMMRALRGMAGRRLYITRRDLVAPEELALAVSLLSEMRVAAVRDALMVRLQCGRQKAYSLITSALQARAGLIKGTKASPDGLRQLAFALDDTETT